MQVVHGSVSLVGKMAHAVGIGIFDGVHRGHQALLSEVKRLASAEGIASLAYTFHPHPARVLSNKGTPQLIEPLEMRIARIADLGIDTIVVEPFNHAFAAIEAEVFIDEVLCRRLAARHVVVGENFTFGRNRGGNVQTLQAAGAHRGFAVHPVSLLLLAGEAVTSTRIRKLIAAGDVAAAAELLGHSFVLSGQVVRGAGRGAGLGFATANLATDSELLPAPGVYAACAATPGGRWRAVVNIGVAPTFGEGSLKIEAHLLDYGGGHLYGTSLALELVERIRAEQRFASVDALRAQVAADIDRGRAILAASRT